MKKLSLTTWIFVSLIAGIIAGFIFQENIIPLGIIGDLWLNLIKLIVVPLILFILMQTIGRTEAESGMGKVVLLTIPYFIITTLIAGVIGSVLALVTKPGAGFHIENVQAEAVPDVTPASFLESLVTDNIFASMSEGNVLQVLIVAILLGVAIRFIPNSGVRSGIITGVDYITELIFSYIKIVIAISPIGIFFLMAATIGENGSKILGSFASLIGLFYIGVLAQIFLVYGTTVWSVGKVNPFTFLKRSSKLWLFTASTASSAAAIPVSLGVARERFGVKESIRNFVIPLGSQINHDGNAIMLPLMAVFAGQAAGMQFSFTQLIGIVLLGTLLSFGGGGIPGSGIVKVLIVMQAFGLPMEIGAMAAGFYRLFDMGITTANSLGDLAGAVAINRLMGRDLGKKNKSTAGTAASTPGESTAE
jgi:Na+/H+-dicarboxylate symporter